MFSDLWEEVDERTYKTHHHAFQAAKFRCIKDNEEAQKHAYSFCLESDSKLSKGSGRQAFRARKKVMLTPDEMAIWESCKNSEKSKIYKAKFRLDSMEGKALMATGKAKIINKGPRLKTIVCEKLINRRQQLNHIAASLKK